MRIGRVTVHGSRSKVLDDNSIAMASSSDAIAYYSQVETERRRSVSPTFLRALGLMKVTTKETTVTRVPLSKSRGTKTNKNVSGSHTSTSKELIRPHKKRSKSKSVAARSTTEKTFVVKKKHVSKSKARAKKRSHATSFDEPQSKPVVVVKKTRKPAAPANKPTTKKRQHKASPPATKVSSPAPQSTSKPAENLSEFTSAADESIRREILDRKKEHVSKSKARAKKGSHATSFDEPQSKPVVVVEKPRKPAAPATDKPTTKKRRHKASPPATKVSSPAPQSTSKPAENLSEFTSAADESIWREILDSDFKSDKYTMLLRNNQFTEEQIVAIRKSFQHLCRMFCYRPTIREGLMKRYECTECHYSISHECPSIDSTQYWPFGGTASCIDFIAPEEITMCLCNFTIFHSHKVQQKSKRKAKSPERSPSPRPSSLLDNNRSVYLDCPKCHMNVTITNRNKKPCSVLKNLVRVEGPNCSKFFRYICDHLDYGPRNCPAMSEFYSCRNVCCILFHRCVRKRIVRSFMPIQPHRPMTGAHESEQT